MKQAFHHQDFINDYCDAFANGTSRDVANFYDVPCLTVRGDGSLHTLNSFDEISILFENVLKTYRSEGMASFSASSPLKNPLGSDCHELSCDWSMMRSDGSLIRQWRQTYIFRKAQDDWKIIAAIFHR